MKIKICGITEIETLNYLIENKVNYAGFIFHKNSPRYVTTEFLSKAKELDFKELENNIIMELELPYNQQMKTPTQLLNNFTKKKYNFDKVITPQNLGKDAHEQIMLWGVLKAKNYND